MIYKKEENSGFIVTELTNFLDSIDINKKYEIVGNYDKHMEIYNSAKELFDNNSSLLANYEIEFIQADIKLSQASKDIENVFY